MEPIKKMFERGNVLMKEQKQLKKIKRFQNLSLTSVQSINGEQLLKIHGVILKTLSFHR